MKSIVLFSGGIDSTVALCLAIYRDGLENVIPVTIAYGQRHINELMFAREMAKELGLTHVTAQLDPSPWKLTPLARGTTASGRSRYAMQTGGVSDAFLPGRNVCFLSLALSFAGINGARSIWLAANQDDAAGFPDCRPPFLYAWQQAASAALGDSIHLETPLIDRTKRQVVQLAVDMAIPLDKTWSCYRPVFKVTGTSPCGRCDACIIRQDAIAHAHLP